MGIRASKSRVALIIFCGALMSAPAVADIYKWVDKDGKIHYSDQPPQGVADVKRIKQRAIAATAPAPTSDKPRGEGQGGAKAKTLAEKELEFRRRRVEGEEAQKKEQQAQAAERDKKAHCATLKANKNMYEQGGRIVTYDDKGEKQFLDEAAQKTNLEEIKRRLVEDCS
jgi:hypothetical protein